MAGEPQAYYTHSRRSPLSTTINERTLRHWISKGAVQATRVGPGGTIRLSANEVKKLARETGRAPAS